MTNNPPIFPQPGFQDSDDHLSPESPASPVLEDSADSPSSPSSPAEYSDAKEAAEADGISIIDATEVDGGQDVQPEQ